MKLNIYLNFNGTTEEVFTFYKSVFNTDFTALMRYKDIPNSQEIPPHLHDKIMHIALPIENITLMGTDALEEMGQNLQSGNAINIAITCDSKEQVDTLFTALSAGGRITIPLEDSFWGSYFGACIDKYGIQWMFDFEHKTEK